MIVTINCDLIENWDSFHELFSKIFGFPHFYGRNMNAWIDCMSDIDNKNSRMTKIWINKNDILVIEMKNFRSFKERCFEIYLAILECNAFINERRIEMNEQALIAIALH